MGGRCGSSCLCPNHVSIPSAPLDRASYGAGTSLSRSSGEISGESLVSKRSLSHADLQSEESRKAPVSESKMLPLDKSSRLVEWLMVTKSEPGGSVPRFLVDRGTPPSIVGDAGKFLDWALSTARQDSTATSVPECDVSKCRAPDQPLADTENKTRFETGAASSTNESPSVGEGEASLNSKEFRGLIPRAVGVATSEAHDLQEQLSTPVGLGSSDGGNGHLAESRQIALRVGGGDSPSDTSSEGSFASAMEKSTAVVDQDGNPEAGSTSDESRSQLAHKGLEKELQKLNDQQRKLDMGFAKMQQRLETKQREEAHKDAAAQAKARDKHERELAKHQAKYQRDMDKLAERRAQHELKAELRRRKTADKEDRTRLALELDRVKAERDVVAKLAELLQRQVGELQAQNTTLVTRLGHLEDASRNNSSSASSKTSA